ncbi:hypothetical protein EJ05DRAFT_490317 [Pseudovirgaria hyperparasitica]|uniref:Uncharacterized protein n=1 Tax=Pseudovirgaria hyperparasitica TaxID=470096 RepID=A0A6A6VTH7_9PEZI|nr:uncharacterized protein EJ05DRAFT_490317 [Pseudovirgaria hyperparasitica]KAF2753096.1 hypothetical protein EJ05DRAFT_490317 [Pseudovirgaria hyperparasitica]
MPTAPHAFQEAEIHADQAGLMYFLERSDTWKTIKPYNFHYFPKENFPVHNIERALHIVNIKSMRPLMSSLTMKKEGFQVHSIATIMGYEDFRKKDKVEDIYMRELESYFRTTLPGAKYVRSLDFQVFITIPPATIVLRRLQLRQRDVNFPIAGGVPWQKPQPSLLTHVDVTLDSAKKIIREIYEDQVASEILESRFQVITVWRPLRVPVRDWPLAICDASTVDQNDFVDTDVIYPSYIAENRMLHYNSEQQWYWLPDQKKDEVLVFKAIDTDDAISSRMVMLPTRNMNTDIVACPHGAFQLTGRADNSQPRESIDIRLLVMYADIEYPDGKFSTNAVTATY